MPRASGATDFARYSANWKRLAGLAEPACGCTPDTTWSDQLRGETMMFRFLELALHGWDLWPAFRIPLNADVVLLTGPNGSGKTTFLDAIRQLLNASKLSSKRRLQQYLR